MFPACSARNTHNHCGINAWSISWWFAEELESFQEQASELRRELLAVKSGVPPPQAVAVKAKGGWGKEAEDSSRRGVSGPAGVGSTAALEDAQVMRLYDVQHLCL